MKNIKLLRYFFVVVIILSFLSFKVDAYNGVDCQDFEVSYIEDDGNFRKIACFSNLSDAKSKMRENNDYVVRHKNSVSPMKIIAMNSGIAYTYTYRYSDKSTIGLWKTPYNKNYTNSYVDSHRDIFYLDTTEYDVSNGEGTIRGVISGFEGGLGLEYTDLVPEKYFRNNLTITIGGGVSETAFSFKPKMNYFSVERNGNYLDLVFNYFPGYGKNGGNPNHYKYAIGPAPLFLKENTKYYSNNSYDFYSDVKMTNKVGTSYNYYMFLPLRSKSNISVETYNKFLSDNNISSSSKLFNSGQFFINSQNKYGVNAALIFGIAINESGFGLSNYAMNRNNLFGLNAVDSNTDLASYYSSVEHCIETMFSFYVQSYIDMEDWRFFGSSIGNKGSGMNVKYASDPYWSIKAAKYAYALDKASKNYDGTLTDYKNYDFMMINKFNVAIKKEPRDNAETYKNSAYNDDYQQNFMVIPLAKVDNYYKVQFTNPINNGKVFYYKDIVFDTTYNFDTSIAYIKSDDLTYIYQKEKPVISGDTVLKTNQFKWNNDSILIDGTIYLKGLNSAADRVKHEVIYTDLNNKTYSYTLNTTKNNDIYNYNRTTPLIDLPSGIYNIKLKTTYLDYPEHNTTQIIKEGYNSELKEFNGLIYRFINDSDGLKLRVVKKDLSRPLPKQSLINFEINDAGILNIDGIAFLNNMDSVDKNIIKHQLVLTNTYSKNVAIEDLETYQYDLDLKDGYIYKYIGYRGSVDLKEYNNGNYKIHIRFTNGDVVKDIEVRSNHNKYDNVIKNIGEKTIRLNSIQKNIFEFELNISNEKIDYTKILKPSRRTSYNNVNELSFNEQYLNIDGIALIYQTNMSQDNNVKHSLLLVDRESGEVIEKELDTKLYSVELTKILKSKFDLNYSNYLKEIDISDIKDGVYDLKIKVSTKEYMDIIDVVMFNKTYNKHQYQTKKYNVIINPYTNKVSLKVGE